MSGYAVAVHAHPDRVLLAAADADGVRLLTAAPGGTTPAVAVADFFGDHPPSVVVRVGATPGGAFPGTARVETVPVAVAALAVGPVPPAGPVLVAEARSGRVETVVVRDGTIEPQLRPQFQPHLQPYSQPQSLAATARAVGAVEIVLVGAWPGEPAGAVPAAPCPVRPAGPADPGDPEDPAAVTGAGPDTAAVLGAALLGAGLLVAGQPGETPQRWDLDGVGRGPRPPGAGPAGAGRPGTGPTGPGPPGAVVTGRSWPGAGSRGRSTRHGAHRALRRAALPSVVALGVVLLAAGLLAGGPGPAPQYDGTVVQYGYAVALPAGWEHSGGDPARRRILLTPVGRPDGAELVLVERSLLGFDADREPDRARRELAAGLSGADGVSPPGPGAAPGTHHYTQRPGDGTVVDWFVLFTGTDQLVVGCRRPVAAEPPDACAEVAGSVRRVP
ncbi:hypothetical protein [Pseudonocardia sp. NPDC049635]|uniref:hypothetical protein n=1 Tax=Pseudonocardia sp. NPDC049635 TaxID=3155506 RepID=UPI0033E93877